jgi:hypothetical protein
MGTARFKLRRVLIGVVIGVVAVTLGFYGWVQFRQSQYADRERTVLTHYRNDFTLCIKLGTGEVGCARHVLTACMRDPFWRQDKPFASAGSAPADPFGRCTAKAIAS